MRSGLIAGGWGRFLGDRKVRERIAGIAREIERAHAKELARAGLVRRWLVRRRMRRELAREINRLFPPDAFYAG